MEEELTMDGVISELLYDLGREPIPLKKRAIEGHFVTRDWLRGKIGRHLGVFPLKRSDAIVWLIQDLCAEDARKSAALGHLINGKTGAEQEKAIADYARQFAEWRAVHKWLKKKLQFALKADKRCTCEVCEEARKRDAEKESEASP